MIDAPRIPGAVQGPQREQASGHLMADEASGPVKAAHKAKILEVQQRNEAAHKAAKEKRKAADLKAEIRRRAEARK